MTWFDQTKNSTGKLTTRLSHDAAQVQGVSHFTNVYSHDLFCYCCTGCWYTSGVADRHCCDYGSIFDTGTDFVMADDVSHS